MEIVIYKFCLEFKVGETKILEDRKFINKVFNSGKFLELCISQAESAELDINKLNIDKYKDKIQILEYLQEKNKHLFLTFN